MVHRRPPRSADEILAESAARDYLPGHERAKYVSSTLEVYVEKKVRTSRYIQDTEWLRERP